MKWLIRVVFVLMYAVASPLNALALGTAPSSPPKTDGPFIISEYSFQGSSLRYVQIFNNSDSVAALTGWRIAITTSSSERVLDAVLSGSVAPQEYATASDVVVPAASFHYSASSNGASTGPNLTSVWLIAPSSSAFVDSAAAVTISSTTPRDTSTTPATFYFQRNISSATGNYTSTYSAYTAGSNPLYSDPLYASPASPGLKIIEVYPDAASCAPNNTTDNCQDYVKLSNTSSSAVDLSQFRLRTGVNGQAATSSNTAQLPAQILQPGHNVSFGLNLSSSGSWVWLEDVYGSVRYDETILGYPSVSGHDSEAWSLNPTTNAWQWTVYPTPGDEPNRFSLLGTVNACNGLRLSEIAANTDEQFVEVTNTTASDLDISGCQLQTNRSQSASYIFAAGSTLAPYAYRAISIADTPLTLTKTTSGTVYILSSDASVEVDSRDYENLAENTSLALVGTDWLQTYSVTPNAPNAYSQYLPCDAGYYRNLDTGYCNKIQAASSPTPCDEDQYRSAATNRCRSISAAASSSLQACAANQYRSPDTNRCRLVSSASTTLTPCSAGQERSPTTNRCRKVSTSSIPDAAYKVKAEPVSSTSMLGWWACLLVALLALGYAVWEWRHEIWRWLKGLGRSVAPAK